jgi:hypothetical protein
VRVLQFLPFSHIKRLNQTDLNFFKYFFYCIKGVARFSDNMLLSDFSLQKWMSQEGLIQSMPWTEYYTSKLLNLLNISPFLLEDTCIDNEGNNSWVSGNMSML